MSDDDVRISDQTGFMDCNPVVTVAHKTCKAYAAVERYGSTGRRRRPSRPINDREEIEIRKEGRENQEAREEEAIGHSPHKSH
jgi:hypothetical protein